MKKKYTFKFLKSRNTNPKRVVILGSSGIVSTNLQKILREKKHRRRFYANLFVG